MANPLVSVLLAVRDGEAHLLPALHSILAQTYSHLELIVIDDGSRDGTPALLDRLADRRLVRLVNPTPQGLAAALNRGLAAAQGVYIARMDADDLALPQRLARQVDCMEQQPALAAVGSALEMFTAQGARHVPHRFTQDAAIRAQLLFDNAIAHPTVMLRRALLLQHGLSYDESLDSAQDYDLFARLADYGQLANLPEVLLHYRWQQDGQVSIARRQAQQANARRIRERLLRRHFPAVSEEQVRQHHHIAERHPLPTPQAVAQAIAWLTTLQQAPSPLPPQAMEEVLAWWWGRLWQETAPSWGSFAHFRDFPLSRRAFPDPNQWRHFRRAAIQGSIKHFLGIREAPP